MALTDAQERVIAVLEQGPATLGPRTEAGRVSASSARSLERDGLVSIDGDVVTLTGGSPAARRDRRGSRLAAIHGRS